MIKPMLAATMEQARKKNTITRWSDWVAEVKYDGIRLLVERTAAGRVEAWTRTRDGLRFDLPMHLINQLVRLAPGIYDGEAINGDVSTDVKRTDLRHTMHFVLFDVVELRGSSTARQTYDDRRVTLEWLYKAARLEKTFVSLAIAVPIDSESDLALKTKAVWDNGGEGLILKKRTSFYLPDKRTPEAWVKIKRELHAELMLVGFEPSKGSVRFPGHPFAIVRLRDDDGNETTAKVVNDYEHKRITDAWHKAYPNALINTHTDSSKHPWVGRRRVVIEFQQRTRDGGYRGPVRFDRWADE